MSNNAIPRDFVKNVLQNGVGRYVCQLKRITFRFCKSHGGSRHMRDFIENNLLEFTQKNPGVVCYLQPRRHRPPSVVAEFLNGRREVMLLSGKEVPEICKWVEHMRTRSGVQIVNMIQNNHTETPSTQGIWHPFMFRDSEMAATEFPSKKFSQIQVTGKTATDLVLEEQLKVSSSESSDSHIEGK
ncbi:39S ribosomal protein L43, mitochondrial [Aplysia californica]|uniref:Large ribosomal subunit protein mL43 n=1 Tax=Aplysia californica TaxID=6500 RepID=A0ABM0JC90_APLCA|nr:39S ribosomal protein L43, mitochondrial [Aplysia californica]